MIFSFPFFMLFRDSVFETDLRKSIEFLRQPIFSESRIRITSATGMQQVNEIYPMLILP